MHESILVLDDDAQRRAVHAFGLCCAGFRAHQAADVHAAHVELVRHRPDLVLLFAERLDAPVQALAQALVGGSGPRGVPVVAVLTAATAKDAAFARELGLSDCLVGPVAPRTLVDRVQACLGCGRATRVLRFGLELDVDSGILSRGASSVILGPAERRLLAALIEQSDRVLSRSQLQPRVGGARAMNPGRVIDVSVCRLRRALRKLECGDILQTIRGRGYRLAARESRPRSAASGVGQASEDPERFFVRRGNAPVPFRDYIGVEQ